MSLTVSLEKSRRASIARALRTFMSYYGLEIHARYLSTRGHLSEFMFTGSGCGSCCVYDYFDNLALILEESLGIPCAVCDVNLVEIDCLPSCLVRIIQMDFLEQLRSVIEEVGVQVRERLAEFKRTGMDEKLTFNEMCFCILTANYTAKGGIRIQQEINEGFQNLTQEELAGRLKSLSYRFPNSRASYICENRALYGSLKNTLTEFKDGPRAREWLVKNVKGFGYKEASHFLRNIGYTDVAIIDRHILKYLVKHGLVEPTKTISPRKYLEMERILLAIAKRLSVSLAELDLYLWYMATGKILK